MQTDPSQKSRRTKFAKTIQILGTQARKITRNKNIDIYYDYPIPIARHIEGGCIKPDILIHNKVDKTAKIIKVGVTCDTILSVTEIKTSSKYQNLKNSLKDY